MKQTGRPKPIYSVQALERALDILECFSFQNRELTLSDVVQRTGLNKTTAKRLIANLTAREYLQQDARGKTYQLGMRLFELGGIVFSSFSLRRAAASQMKHLQSETEATVLLGVRMEDQLVYLDRREGNGMIRIASDIGWHRPLHFGMLGMVLMAHLDQRESGCILERQPLEAHTPLSITDRDAFSLRLEQIRAQGYVLEKGEAVAGAVGIAAPVRDYTRQVVAAVGIALPLGYAGKNNDWDRLVALVKSACAAISSELGYLKI
jgi:IclR family transcriptional regulator, KDG regulon repressor